MSRTPRLVISTVPYLGLISAGALVLMVAGCGGDSVSNEREVQSMKRLAFVLLFLLCST